MTWHCPKQNTPKIDGKYIVQGKTARCYCEPKFRQLEAFWKDGQFTAGEYNCELIVKRWLET
jgi:hypothetical protein